MNDNATNKTVVDSSGNSNDGSICLWVKIKTIAASKVFYSSDESGADRFYLVTRGTGTDFGIGLSDWNENFGGINFLVDTWYFLVVILDGTTGYVYKDNVLVASHPGITVNLPTVNTIKLGAGATGGGYYLHCEMDAVMIFNKALTEEEIAFLWNEGNGREYLGTARSLVGGSLASGRKGLV
jgi:hypothetical protein